MKKIILRCAIITGLIFATLWIRFPSKLNKIQSDAIIRAKSDITEGRPRYLLYGELAPYEAEITKLMQERYKVQLDRVAGCILNESQAAEYNAYNQTISKHFGFTDDLDIFHSTLNEVFKIQNENKK